jgi:ribosomal protein S3AE
LQPGAQFSNGRTAETNSQVFRKIKLRAGDVQCKNVLTNFWGMGLTKDKLWSLGCKWQCLIEAHVDVKATDNYQIRIFCIAFTKKRPNQIKKTCYTQSSQICQIRRNISEIMVREAPTCDLKELVAKCHPSILQAIKPRLTTLLNARPYFVRRMHPPWRFILVVRIGTNPSHS